MASRHEDLATFQMCDALQELQEVRSFNFDDAYRTAFAGIASLDPRDEVDSELIVGMILAYRVWRDGCYRTLQLRHEVSV